MRRVATVLGVALVAVLLVGSALLLWRLRASLPRVTGTETLSGLSAAVTVIRDRGGVPHIFAESPADAQRALGFVQAQDRRLLMEIGRRFAAGRLAEVTGEARASRSPPDPSSRPVSSTPTGRCGRSVWSRSPGRSSS